jgi:hypothetical protein
VAVRRGGSMVGGSESWGGGPRRWLVVEAGDLESLCSDGPIGLGLGRAWGLGGS